MLLPVGSWQVDDVANFADANSVTGKMFTVAIGALRFTELSKIRSSSSDEAYNVSSYVSRYSQPGQGPSQLSDWYERPDSTYGYCCQ